MLDPLVSYLEDHKAGAGLAIGLLKAMKARHDDEALSQFAGSILADGEQDEQTLQRLTKEIGTGSNILKEAAAWVGEKASRVKLGAGVSGDFGASRRWSSSRWESRESSVFGTPSKPLPEQTLACVDSTSKRSSTGLKNNTQRWRSDG